MIRPSFYRHRSTRRFLSAVTSQNIEVFEAGVSVQGSASVGLGRIVRHGEGDACITLNVGGKEFYTLRSTVAGNAVLADHVARAEANKEITKNGAVFIDRDPAHFGFILQHLRNCSVLPEHIQGKQKMTLQKFTKSHTHFPEDQTKLRELFLETQFYRIEELEYLICAQKWYLNIFGLFSGGGGNPFDSAQKLFGRLRAGLLAFGSVGTIGSVTVATQQKYDDIVGFFGLQKKDKDS